MSAGKLGPLAELVEAVEKESERLGALLERARAWMVHDRDCAKSEADRQGVRIHEIPAIDCTCGLDALLVQFTPPGLENLDPPAMPGEYLVGGDER